MLEVTSPCVITKEAVCCDPNPTLQTNRCGSSHIVSSQPVLPIRADSLKLLNVLKFDTSAAALGDSIGPEFAPDLSHAP